MLCSDIYVGEPCEGGGDLPKLPPIRHTENFKCYDRLGHYQSQDRKESPIRRTLHADGALEGRYFSESTSMEEIFHVT